MQCPRAAIFDLDDTLAESFKPPSKEMLGTLSQLFDLMPVAIMTGAGLNRMESQFLPALARAPRIDRFYLFPSSSSQCYVYRDDAWQNVYTLALTPEERTRIKSAILETVATADGFRQLPRYGQQMFDREAQVAYSLIGVDAPFDLKRSWDPDGTKRSILRDELQKALPEFEVLLGGTTTVDVTRKGINKSYGVSWLSKELGIAPPDMLYVGDALFPGGNDEVVIPTGVVTRAVSGPAETLALVRELVHSCAYRA